MAYETGPPIQSALRGLPRGLSPHQSPPFRWPDFWCPSLAGFQVSPEARGGLRRSLQQRSPEQRRRLHHAKGHARRAPAGDPRREGSEVGRGAKTVTDSSAAIRVKDGDLREAGGRNTIASSRQFSTPGGRRSGIEHRVNWAPWTRRATWRQAQLEGNSPARGTQSGQSWR